MGQVRSRKDLVKLERSEMQALVDGFEGLYSMEGGGGFRHIASVYGQHARAWRSALPLLFLPWHRAYLLVFEQALDRFVPGLSIAYWDWTAGLASGRSIPGRLRAVAYKDQDDAVWLNALCRAPIDSLGHETYTTRAPKPPLALEPVVARLQEAARQPGFEAFSAGLQDASRELRAWVGGHMDDDQYASFDPVFWFHHAHLDRAWASWQQAHPGEQIPASLVDADLPPFNVKVRDVLEAHRTIYVYEPA